MGFKLDAQRKLEQEALISHALVSYVRERGQECADISHCTCLDDEAGPVRLFESDSFQRAQIRPRYFLGSLCGLIQCLLSAPFWSGTPQQHDFIYKTTMDLRSTTCQSCFGTRINKTLQHGMGGAFPAYAYACSDRVQRQCKHWTDGHLCLCKFVSLACIRTQTHSSARTCTDLLVVVSIP